MDDPEEAKEDELDDVYPGRLVDYAQLSHLVYQPIIQRQQPI